MSTGSHAGDAGDTSTHHGHEGHGATQYVHDEGGAAHGTLKGYLTGFVLSVFLTAIPFWLVMARPMAILARVAAPLGWLLDASSRARRRRR